MPIISDIKDGLGTRLATISGLRVYNHAPGAIEQFPAAFIMVDSINYKEGIGGTTISGTLRAVVFINRADVPEALNELDAYLDPSGARSVMLAVQNDATLGTTVDGAYVSEAVNVGMREEQGGWYAGADFLVPFWRK